MIKFEKAINEFHYTPTARNLIINSFKQIIPSKGNRFAFFTSLIFAIIFSYQLSVSEYTVEYSHKVTSTLMSILLTLFGCIFTVYSILIAFLSDKIIEKLALIEGDDNETYLKKYLIYYESVLFLYFICIAITGLIALFCECIPPMFRISDNLMFDNILAFFLLCIYLLLTFRVIYEVKSTIYNTICISRFWIAHRLIGIEEEDIDE